MKFSAQALQGLKSSSSADGLINISNWVQAPTPTTAGLGKPSGVFWARGMGKDEAKGVIRMYEEIIAYDEDWYLTDRKAALAVLRAFQVLGRAPPKDFVETHWPDKVPDLKGMYYYSATQIVQTGPELSRQLEAVEELAGSPYMKILEPFFLAEYHANGKLYQADDATARGLANPPFVSKMAAKTAQDEYDAKTKGKAGVASATTAAATVDATPPAKRTRGSGGTRSDGTRTAVTPASGGKLTARAKRELDTYMASLNTGESPDHKLMAYLASLSD